MPTYNELSIDLETYSSVNLKKAGLYQYTTSPDFEIILFAWAFDNEDVSVHSGLAVPKEVISALTDPRITKTAFNAAFEIAALESALNIKLDPAQWQCTMVQCAMLGLPQSLDAAGRALELDTTKDAAGKALIKYFCMPCTPTKANGMRTRNMPHHDPGKWFDFENYCVKDVVQERLIKQKLNFFKPSETERLIYRLDHKINSRGMMVDVPFIESAILMASTHKDICMQRAIELTGLDNPGSVKQIKGWLESAIDAPIESLKKADIPGLKKQMPPGIATEVLELREEFSKTSVKKYDAMRNAVADDNRVRGLLQYYGASRTGRWAGRLIQVHNLPRNTMKMLDEARELVKANDLESISLLWKSPPDVLSQLIRTAFIAAPGQVLISSDFSAIEARVTAWLAGEAWRINVFNTHGKIYEASASTMFKVPLESISYKDEFGETVKGPNYHLRQNGKVSELALGFGGGPNALVKMGALEMDFIKVLKEKSIKEYPRYAVCAPVDGAAVFGTAEEYADFKIMKELAKLVRMWRNASPKIKQYWDDVHEAVIEAVSNPGTTVSVKQAGQLGISYKVEHDILWCTLPSGRKLTYYSPKLKPGKYGSPALTYLGIDQKINKWIRQDTYGGKLVENIVQAVARDLLAEALLRLDKNGFNINMHVHDEVILEVPEEFAESSVKIIDKLMAKQPYWANGLPLNAESSIFKYYKKD